MKDGFTISPRGWQQIFQVKWKPRARELFERLQTAGDQGITPGGPPDFFTKSFVGGMSSALARKGLPFRIRNYGGTYRLVRSRV